MIHKIFLYSALIYFLMGIGISLADSAYEIHFPFLVSLGVASFVISILGLLLGWALSAVFRKQYYILGQLICIYSAYDRGWKKRYAKYWVWRGVAHAEKFNGSQSDPDIRWLTNDSSYNNPDTVGRMYETDTMEEDKPNK